MGAQDDAVWLQGYAAGLYRAARRYATDPFSWNYPAHTRRVQENAALTSLLVRQILGIES